MNLIQSTNTPISTIEMTKNKPLFQKAKIQYLAAIVLFIGVLAMTVVLSNANSLYFQRFIGYINPIIVILLSGIVGLLLLSFLLSKKWFVIFKTHYLKGALRHSWLVVVFVSVAILVDLKIVFPIDMIIPFPQSLLFYPIIAFFIEMIFHVLPLSLPLLSLTFFFRHIGYKRLRLISIVLVAILEPTYQAIFMISSPTWSIVGIWVNLFVFNMTQLFIFMKYDFISMFAFRLKYYLIWHIIWGHIRLDVLF